MKRILPLVVAVAGLTHAEIAVRVGEVWDTRTTSDLLAGCLKIQLCLAGAELADARGMRMTVASATDDTGKNLVDHSTNPDTGDVGHDPFAAADTGKKERSFFIGEFKPLRNPLADLKGVRPVEGVYQVMINLANPERAAKTVKLAGKLELWSPKADPASVVTAKVAWDAGKPLDNPALKAAGVEITFHPPVADRLAYELKDPKGKVAAVEFCTADGKAQQTYGDRFKCVRGSRGVTVNVPNLRDGVLAKIYLLTEKSLLLVPFKMDAIKLP